MATKNPKEGEKKKNKQVPKKEKGKPGRPSLLTPEVEEAFTTAVSIGASYVLASRYAGISEDTATLWMRDGRKELARQNAGEKPDPHAEPFLRFLRAVREAEADAGIAWMEVLNKAAKVDPQWAYKMLRTRFPTDFTEMNVTSDVEIPSDMTIEYLDRIIAGEPAIKVVKEWNEFQSSSASTPIEKADTKPAKRSK